LKNTWFESQLQLNSRVSPICYLQAKAEITSPAFSFPMKDSVVICAK
jgi:hypothetical protein